MDMPPHARAVTIGRGHRFAAYPRCSVDSLEVDGTESRNWRYTGPHGVAHGFGHTSALFGSRPPIDPAAAHENFRQLIGKNRQLVRIPGKSG
jgi:hypothetical protein